MRGSYGVDKGLCLERRSRHFTVASFSLQFTVLWLPIFQKHDVFLQENGTFAFRLRVNTKYEIWVPDTDSVHLWQKSRAWCRKDFKISAVSYGVGKGVLVGFPKPAFHRRIVFFVIDDTVASDLSKNRTFVVAKECNPRQSV